MGLVNRKLRSLKTEFPTPEIIRGVNDFKLSAQRCLESGWTRVKNDWFMVALNTIGHRPIITKVCLPYRSQKSLRLKFVPILPEVYEVGNTPFYRYGGLIELIRFKEYYRMPRGHEHISFVFSSAFRDIFS